MTQEEIIAMLASIGVEPDRDRPRNWRGFVAVFERFAALVAAKEREACLEIADMEVGISAYRIARRIRARGTKEGV